MPSVMALLHVEQMWWLLVAVIQPLKRRIQLVPYARSITIMVRGDSMRAAVTMQERLSNYPSIKVRYNASITEVIGDENVMTDMMVCDNKTGTTTREPIFMIFLAIGHVPNTWMLGNQVSVCKTGHIALFNSRKQHRCPVFLQRVMLLITAIVRRVLLRGMV